MYTPPFIPRADGAFRNMAAQFARTISADPARYMLSPAEAENILKQFVEFDEAYRISSNPETRTRGTICNKDDARSILRHTIRVYGSFIRINRGITDGDKVAVGVRPLNPSHRRRWCPTTNPLLQYQGSIPGMDQLRFHSSDSPTSSAKPFGAERLELWVAYSAPRNGEVRPQVSQSRLIGSYKKSKMLVDQDPARDVRLGGTDGLPTYWGRWVGFAGDVGPWSRPLVLAAVNRKARAAKAAEVSKDASSSVEAKPVRVMTEEAPLLSA